MTRVTLLTASVQFFVVKTTVWLSLSRFSTTVAHVRVVFLAGSPTTLPAATLRDHHQNTLLTLLAHLPEMTNLEPDAAFFVAHPTRGLFMTTASTR